MKPLDFQIVEYSATRLAICLTAAASPYTLTPLSNTISMEGSVAKKGELPLQLRGWYDKGEEVATSRVNWVLVRKQLSYAMLTR